MNLFLNAVSESGIIILFDKSRKILKTKSIHTLGNESEKLSLFLDEFLDESNIEYKDLNNIVVVAGPGSFTGIRTISLLVNTISFVFKDLHITPINFFDLYSSYPIIKSSSKRDSFIQKNQNSSIEVLKNDEIIEFFHQNNVNKIFGENKNIVLENNQIFENIDYFDIIKNIKFDKLKKIDPIYIKKPSIS